MATRKGLIAFVISLFVITLCWTIYRANDKYYNIYAQKLTNVCINIIDPNSNRSSTGQVLGPLHDSYFIANGLVTLCNTGYKIEDISGDGIPELIIGHKCKNENNEYLHNTIAAIFTCADGKPQLVFGTANCYLMYWKGGNNFVRLGHGGLYYETWSKLALSYDGTELIYKGSYFEHDKDNVYCSPSHPCDLEIAEKTSMTHDDFFAMIEEGRQEALEFDPNLTPFIAYAAENNKRVFAAYVFYDIVRSITKRLGIRI
ncbi:MAG: hypothetical protein K6G50_04725 [bacterium]|nr:hypothetical protein [bacterium]